MGAVGRVPGWRGYRRSAIASNMYTTDRTSRARVSTRESALDLRAQTRHIGTLSIASYSSDPSFGDALIVKTNRLRPAITGPILVEWNP